MWVIWRQNANISITGKSGHGPHLIQASQELTDKKSNFIQVEALSDR